MSQQFDEHVTQRFSTETASETLRDGTSTVSKRELKFLRRNAETNQFIQAAPPGNVNFSSLTETIASG